MEKSDDELDAEIRDTTPLHAIADIAAAVTFENGALGPECDSPFGEPPFMYRCTRPEGHLGFHVAVAGHADPLVCAIWRF